MSTPLWQILVDPAPLLALRALLDQILAGAHNGASPCAVLQIAEDHLVEKRPWVAELVVTPHGFQRAFLRGRRDYSEANKKGRGVRHCFVLRPGCTYEVAEITRKGEHRYLCRVVNGDVTQLTPDEAQRWADGLHYVESGR